MTLFTEWPSHPLLLAVIVFLHKPFTSSIPTFSFSLLHPKLTRSPFGPCSPLHSRPPAPLRWWLPIDQQFTQSFGQGSNCVFSLCGLHREGIDHQLMRDVGRGGGGEMRKRPVVLRRGYCIWALTLLLLNALVAIIPTSRLHYCLRSIDLKSELSIS